MTAMSLEPTLRFRHIAPHHRRQLYGFRRTIHDALEPNLRPTGVPRHKAFLHAAWRPVDRLTVAPSLEVAGNRWSDVTTAPVQAFPHTRTGNYTLIDLSAQYRIERNFDVVFGMKNLTDDNYALAWGL